MRDLEDLLDARELPLRAGEADLARERSRRRAPREGVLLVCAAAASAFAAAAATALVRSPSKY